MKIMLSALALLYALVAPAAQPQTPLNVFMFDDVSCEAWTKSAGNKMVRAQYEFWMRGFVTGHNFANPSRQVAVGSFPKSEALHEYITRYCGDNPQSTFVMGAMRLVEELRKPAAGAKSPAKSRAVK